MVVRGVTPDEVFDFVLDPAQYTKADTKMVWVTKLADVPGGMLAREDGKFLGLLPGSVVTRYRWERPGTIDVTLEHGVPARLARLVRDRGRPRRHARPPRGGDRNGPRTTGHAPRRRGQAWFAQSVAREVTEIGAPARGGGARHSERPRGAGLTNAAPRVTRCQGAVKRMSSVRR